MTEVHITPQDDFQAKLKSLGPGDILLMENGVYREAKLSRKPSDAWTNTIRAINPGKVLIRSSSRTVDGLALTNCPGFIVEGIGFEGGARGLYATSCDGIVIQACVFRNNQKQGVLVSETNEVSLIQCEAFGTEEQHGAYISRCLNALVSGGKYHDNPRCGVQFNWQGSASPIYTIDNPKSFAGTIRGVEIFGNGAAGGAGANLLDCRGDVVACNIHDNLSGSITFFAAADCTAEGNNILGPQGIASTNQSVRCVARQNVIHVTKPGIGAFVITPGSELADYGNTIILTPKGGTDA